NTRIEYSDALEPVTVVFSSNQGFSGLTYLGASGTATGGPSVGTDTFTGVNAVQGSAFDDTLTGSNNPSGSTETFAGRGGNDFIMGNGNTQIAFYDAREGVTITFTSNQGIVGGVYQGASGTAVGGTSVGTDAFSGVSIVHGSNYGDTITGSNNPSNTTETF